MTYHDDFTLSTPLLEQLTTQGLDAALSQLVREEAAAVQAQIAGIKAGASPEAYGAVFADLAGQRNDLENRLRAVTQMLQADDREQKTAGKAAKTKGDKGAAGEVARQALSDIALVLASDAVPGWEKRDLIGSVISRVVC